ncbi:unnamed protein product [Adineta ricciae]|uniref:Uncharacterized protein n=1 Tax=Adineta ricciae TaxID=249248 RepID=A0A814VUF9_ADIRI|nr:unnamed protein product [Adineta ricciae]CAF1192044.1 unnamed protein product [Adineta ricciae]
MTQETIDHDQGKYFHRKRRLLAAEQIISYLFDNDYPLMKKSQAEQDDDGKHLQSNPDNSTGDDDEHDRYLYIKDEN